MPPGNGNDYERVYGRPAVEGAAGLGAMGRFGQDTRSDLYDLVYGEIFYVDRVCSPEVSPTSKTGFQTMEHKERQMALKKANAKAAITASQVRPAAERFRYQVWPETKDSMVAHSEQFKIKANLSFDDWGRMNDNGIEAPLFPNVVRKPMEPVPETEYMEPPAHWPECVKQLYKITQRGSLHPVESVLKVVK